MKAQLSLLDPTIDDRFEKFHAANGHVFDRIVELLRQAQRAGKTRVGMKMIFEVLRWEHWLRTSRDDSFMLNNVYTSRYSRLVMKLYPDLGALLETRRLRAA